MKKLLPLLALVLVGCSEPKIIYVDSEGKPIANQSVELQGTWTATEPSGIFKNLATICLDGYEYWYMDGHAATQIITPRMRTSQQVKECQQ